MLSELGREIVDRLNNKCNLRSLNYCIKQLDSLDDERVKNNQICCDRIGEEALCLKCFEYHLDRLLSQTLKTVLEERYPSEKP